MGNTMCSKYQKKFRYQVTTMGVHGGKEREYIYCPYCGQKNGSEVTSGFVYTYKIEDNKNPNP